MRSRSFTERALTTPPTWTRKPGGKVVKVKNGNSCCDEKQTVNDCSPSTAECQLTCNELITALEDKQSSYSGPDVSFRLAEPFRTTCPHGPILSEKQRLYALKEYFSPTELFLSTTVINNQNFTYLEITKPLLSHFYHGC